MTESSPRRVLTIVTFSHLFNHLNGTSMTFILSVYVAVSLKFSPSQIGLISAIGAFASGLLQLPFSFLIRKYTVNSLLAFGNGVMGAGMVMFGMGSNVAYLSAAKVVNGLGSAPQHPVGASAISDSFDAKMRGRALGLHNGLSYMGNVLGPPVALGLVSYFGDWRIACFVLGALMLPAFFSVLFGMKQAASSSSDASKASTGRTPLRTFLGVLRDRNVLLTTLGASIVSGGRGYGLLVTFIPIYLINFLGFGAEIAALLTTVYLLGGPPGGYLLGSLSDRWNRKYATIMALLVMGTMFYAMTLTRNVILLGAILFVLGVVGLNVTSLLQSYLSDISQPAERDMAFGIFFTLSFGVSAVWTAVAGLLIDTLGFQLSFGFLALTALPAALLILATKPFVSRES